VGENDDVAAVAVAVADADAVAARIVEALVTARNIILVVALLSDYSISQMTDWLRVPMPMLMPMPMLRFVSFRFVGMDGLFWSD